ncbi:DUF3649 domain-containing protein [Marinimicrobium locisalis]|uniref:DUF3649 domain-containing protein n=1 Tax=Marinimicrobium locisalis TaxID=546022 RepID=UPI003221C938
MPKSLPRTPLLLDIASRCVAALLGGYVLSITLPPLLGLSLPVSRAQATLTALLLSFIVYTAAFLWAFAVRNHWRAWGGLLVPSLACGTFSLLILSVQTGTPA